MRASAGQSRAAILVLASMLIAAAGIAPAATRVDIPAPKLNAGSYILYDHLSGRVLVEHNADERVEPASLTKIMAVYVTGHALEDGLVALDDEVTVSEKAWKTGGSRTFIEVGKSVAVDDLLQGVIVQSGNDASVALAEHVSGSEDVFAGIMTSRGRELGMSNSSFGNSTGLPDANTYTTARDMAILSSALIREFPELYARFSIAEFTYNNIRQANRNRLLMRDDSFDGIKTGHTEAAGYCLVSSAIRDGTRLIAAVMGTESDAARTEASETLINYGFRFFETRKLYERNDVVVSPRIWKGTVERLDLGVPDPVYVSVPRGRYDDLEAVARLDEPIIAPVRQDQPIGQVSIMLDGDELALVPLVALSDIATGSLFSRLYDAVMLLFE